MMDKQELPGLIYLVMDLHGKLHAFENLNECPVYYDDEKGILVGEYVLERTGTLKKEIRYINTKEH